MNALSPPPTLPHHTIAIRKQPAAASRKIVKGRAYTSKEIKARFIYPLQFSCDANFVNVVQWYSIQKSKSRCAPGTSSTPALNRQRGWRCNETRRIARGAMQPPAAAALSNGV